MKRSFVMLDSKYFNLYELVRQVYLNKNIDVCNPRIIHLSKDDLDKNYFRVPAKEGSHIQIVILNRELYNTDAKQPPTKYILLKESDAECIIVLDSSIFETNENDPSNYEIKVLSADNLDSNVVYLSDKIEQEESKEESDKFLSEMGI